METDPMKTREEEKVKQVWTGSAALFFDLDYGLTYFDFRIQKNYSFVSICKKDIGSNHPVNLQMISTIEMWYVQDQVSQQFLKIGQFLNIN